MQKRINLLNYHILFQPFKRNVLIAPWRTGRVLRARLTLWRHTLDGCPILRLPVHQPEEDCAFWAFLKGNFVRDLITRVAFLMYGALACRPVSEWNATRVSLEITLISLSFSLALALSHTLRTWHFFFISFCDNTPHINMF